MNGCMYTYQELYDYVMSLTDAMKTCIKDAYKYFIVSVY